MDPARDSEWVSVQEPPALDHVDEALDASAEDTRQRLLELRRVVNTLSAD